MRRRAKVDLNQRTLVAAFRKLGCDVLHTHTLGKGYPDCFVAYAGLWLAIEIKGEKGKLSDAQESLYGKLRTQPRIVRNVEDVSATVATLRRWHVAISSYKQHLTQDNNDTRIRIITTTEEQ